MVDKTDPKMIFSALGPTLITLESTKVGHNHLKPTLAKNSSLIKCKSKKMLLEKYVDFHTARN